MRAHILHRLRGAVVGVVQRERRVRKELACGLDHASRALFDEGRLRLRTDGGSTTSCHLVEALARVDTQRPAALQHTGAANHLRLFDLQLILDLFVALRQSIAVRTAALQRRHHAIDHGLGEVQRRVEDHLGGVTEGFGGVANLVGGHLSTLAQNVGGLIDEIQLATGGLVQLREELIALVYTIDQARGEDGSILCGAETTLNQSAFRVLERGVHCLGLSEERRQPGVLLHAFHQMKRRFSLLWLFSSGDSHVVFCLV
mmetsp:Transcript_29524/g.74306  ORF Transcript_29524/g.74306 Transcript_29524/m.74306 type:complete len:258 (+) Transcript_29524:939-1712(+)